jgi:hypothetical protein
MQISKSKHYYMLYLGTNRNVVGESLALLKGVLWIVFKRILVFYHEINF